MSSNEVVKSLLYVGPCNVQQYQTFLSPKRDPINDLQNPRLGLVRVKRGPDGSMSGWLQPRMDLRFIVIVIMRVVGERNSSSTIPVLLWLLNMSTNWLTADILGGVTAFPFRTWSATNPEPR